MSYLDDASLVVIPSGYEPSTVFAVKPTDGTGDLTFTRSNDTATRVGPDGLIEKVRTNVALYSEQFNNANWGPTNATVTANTTTAPDGTTTADSVAFTASSSARLEGITAGSSPAGEVTLSIYAKVASGTGSFRLRGDWSGGNSISTDFAVTTSWQRFTHTFTAASALQIMSLYNNTAGTAQTVIFWGAQAESGVATPYIATTTAAVSVGPVANVPRLDYLNSSCPRLLLEPQRTNITLFSEQMNNAAWTAINCTVSANAATSPDGYTNADSISTTAANSFFGAASAVTISADASIYTQSVFVKWVSGSEIVKLRAALTGGTSVAKETIANVRTGVITYTDSTAQIVSYGNGWYRISQQITNNSTNTNFNYQFYPTNDGTNTNVISLWGCMAELGAYATSYIPTLGAAVTRGADNTTGPNAGTLGITGAYSIFYELGDFNVSASSTWIAQSGAAGRMFEAFGTTMIIKAASGDVYPYNHGLSGTQFKAVLSFDGTNVTAFANGNKYGPYPANLAQWTGYTNLDLNLNLLQTVNWKQVLLFPIALSDADAIALTA